MISLPCCNTSQGCGESLQVPAIDKEVGVKHHRRDFQKCMPMFLLLLLFVICFQIWLVVILVIAKKHCKISDI
jgi:hypothetical protein